MLAYTFPSFNFYVNGFFPSFSFSFSFSPLYYVSMLFCAAPCKLQHIPLTDASNILVLLFLPPLAFGF
ncbi:CFC_collapsed_G0016740.mRNA.1.CDS.1 [Saccharomyces cerevisiae]|nr:CFC_collapsed_G0016740.mRNA.1.CDS.1 [Saccharomyces cerevisiae]